MKYTLTILFTCIITLLFSGARHLYVLSETEFFQEKLASEALVATNKYRARLNLTPVIENSIVCDLATARAVEISTDFSHDKFMARFENSSYGRYIDFANYTVFGENLSRNFDKGEDVVNAWINSPKHKEILESTFEYGCIVCYKNYCAFNTIHTK